jgi:hypothetical protein
MIDGNVNPMFGIAKYAERVTVLTAELVILHEEKRRFKWIVMDIKEE